MRNLMVGLLPVIESTSSQVAGDSTWSMEPGGGSGCREGGSHFKRCLGAMHRPGWRVQQALHIKLWHCWLETCRQVPWTHRVELECMRSWWCSSGWSRAAIVCFGNVKWNFWQLRHYIAQIVSWGVQKVHLRHIHEGSIVLETSHLLQALKIAETCSNDRHVFRVCWVRE